MKVEDVMILMGSFPAVTQKTILKEALTEMGEANLGLVCIINDRQELLGLITDGDLRRKINSSPHKKSLDDIVRNNPLVISENTPASKALGLMSEKKITSLLVVSDKDKSKKNKKLIGIIHIHFLLQNKVK